MTKRWASHVGEWVNRAVAEGVVIEMIDIQRVVIGMGSVIDRIRDAKVEILHVVVGRVVVGKAVV